MTDETPCCTCLSLSRDPLCVYHGDIDKVAAYSYTVADFKAQAEKSEENERPVTARMLRQAAILRAQVDQQAQAILGWQSITTAPKDGTCVDLWYQGRRLTDVAWHLEWQQWFAPRGRLVYDPTHWMKLPEAPE